MIAIGLLIPSACLCDYFKSRPRLEAEIVILRISSTPTARAPRRPHLRLASIVSIHLAISSLPSRPARHHHR